MLQFFMFFVIFLFSCLISLRLKFLKNDEGLFRGKITCYDLFELYVLVLQIQTCKMILSFAIFFNFLKIFVFPASGDNKCLLWFDIRALHGL